MPQKKHTNERILRFSYDALTDDEIDVRICKCIRSAREEDRHYNYKWKDEDLALRNYAIWKMLYKQGKSRVETMRNIVSRWGVAQGTAYEYIKIAEKEVNLSYDETTEEMRSKSMEKAQRLYNMAVENNQPKVAIQALDMINKLNGMYTENKNVTINDIRFEFD